MIHSAEVFLWGTRIGIVYQGENDSVAGFEYDRDFLNSGIELSPFQMPLSGEFYRYRAVVLYREQGNGSIGICSGKWTGEQK